jgi:hypothetical protein
MRLLATRLTAIASAVKRLFSPASLFRNSEQGLWYDPSDFSTMFQDSAGTTPVTAVEQPVGLILDKSGNGNHASQSTSAGRPLIKQYNTTNKGLYYDRVDDALTVTLPAGTYTLCASAPSAYGLNYTEFTEGFVHAGGVYTLPQAGVTSFVAINRALTETEKQAIATYNRSHNYHYGVNDIGVAGATFGVGICPALPVGYTGLAGFDDITSANYGNYQYSDGSFMVWVPAFWMRLGHVQNTSYARYGVNSIDIVRLAQFPDETTANAEGYYLHRAFVNAGANQLGLFRDKYDCSANGVIASSIANAMPMVSGPNLSGTPQVGFTAVTGGVNNYGGAISAAKSRGEKFFPESVFIADALCRISEAHAQAATSTTYCAWYDPTGVRNFPKGNDNNALKSEADVTLNGAGAVTFTSAGTTTYPNFALTGSGVPFARTTHNGQACGIADVAGNIYKINPGLMCIAASKTITAATQANPVALTVTAHGYTTGDVVQINSVGGMTQLNNRLYAITVTDANTITLNAVDGTAFTAYTSGGSTTKGVFYALKTSVDIAAVTSGVTLATDHWGATGAAAQFDVVTPNFTTTYPNNAYGQRYGNAANQVFAWDTAANRLLSMLGLPAASGMSPAGSNAMGTDYYYQYMRDQLCVTSRGHWGSGSNAGSRLRTLDVYRTYAHFAVGFACASYL